MPSLIGCHALVFTGEFDAAGIESSVHRARTALGPASANNSRRTPADPTDATEARSSRRRSADTTATCTLPVAATATTSARSTHLRTRLTSSRPPANAAVSVAAVDEGILALTNFATPDPFAFFTAKRAHGVRWSDLYSHLMPEVARIQGSSPVGGDKDGGGRIIAEGAPEVIAKTAISHTGQYLKNVLN